MHQGARTGRQRRVRRGHIGTHCVGDDDMARIPTLSRCKISCGGSEKFIQYSRTLYASTTRTAINPRDIPPHYRGTSVAPPLTLILVAKALLSYAPEVVSTDCYDLSAALHVSTMQHTLF